MNRWRVCKTWACSTPRDTRDPKPWLVKEGRSIFTPALRFSTHAEAVAYADRMARTVEVVLPREAPTRIPAHDGTQNPLWYTFTSRNEEFYCALSIWGPGGEIGIFDERDLKPLALALLAHHHQKEKK